MSGWLSISEINDLGFASVGQNVYLSNKCSFYGTSSIHIGSNVRIDDYCALSAGVGGIYIGSYVHLSTHVTIAGAGKVTISDFSGISSKTSIFSSSDDYLGRGMTNPMVPEKYKFVKTSEVYLGRHSLIGANSVILPGSRLPEGTSVGALSMVSSVLESWSVYVGNPAKRVVKRSKNILKLEKIFLEELEKSE